MDGWSLNIISREISLIYNASVKNHFNPLKPVLINYSQYVNWQNQYLDSDQAKKSNEYWKRRLMIIQKFLG